MEFEFCLILLVQFCNSISDVGAEILNTSVIKNNERIICSNYYEDQDSCFAKCKRRNLSGIDSNIHARILCVDICSADIMWTTLNDTKNNNTFAIQISTAENQSNAIHLVNNSDAKSFFRLVANTVYYVLILKISPTGLVSINDVASLKFRTHIENPKPPVPSWFNVTDLIPVNETFTNLTIKWNFTEEALPCSYEIYWWLDGTAESVETHFPDIRLHEFVIPNLMYEKTYKIWMTSRFRCKQFDFENVTEVYYNIPSYCKSLNNPSINCGLTFPAIPSAENITEEIDCNHTLKCFVDVSWAIKDFQPDYYSVKIEKYHSNNASWLFIKTWNVNTSSTKIEVTPNAFYNLTITTFKNGSPSLPSTEQFFTREEARKTVERKSHTDTNYLPAIISILVFLLVVTFVVIHVQKQKNNKSLNKKYSVEIKNKSILESIIPNVESKKNNAQVHKYQLIPGRMLGKGNFGIVFHGTLMRNNKKVIDVAVKTLQDNANANEIQQFEKEISLMEDVGFHNNIVCMIGSCYNAKRPLLIVEFCSLGDLHTYLCDIKKTLVNFSDFNPTVGNQYQNLITVGNGEQNSKYLVHNRIYGVTTKDVMVPELSICDLLSFGRQVAIGMEYLASNYVVHRDLAARNVLLCNDKTVKISDFGLSRDIYAENIYRKLEGSERMPIKWMALESIRNQEYTTLSDVWSFGIFLWELLTIGDEPYPDISCPQVLYLRLKEGYRMENPCVSYPELYEIMRNCWQETPELRPQFTELYELLDQMLKKCSPNQYITITGTE